MECTAGWSGVTSKVIVDCFIPVVMSEIAMFRQLTPFEQKEASLVSTSSTLFSCLSCARLAVDS